MYLLKLIFTTHEVTTSFLQEQHPFPQTLHLVDDPTTPGIWINNEVQYFAVPRREGSRALFCWKLTIPEGLTSAHPLVKMQPHFQVAAFTTQFTRAVQALLSGILTTLNIFILSLSLQVVSQPALWFHNL